MPGALPTREETGPAGGALPVGAAGLWAGSKQASSAKIGNPRAGVEDSAFSLPANRALPRRRLPHQDNQQERQEASCV